MCVFVSVNIYIKVESKFQVYRCVILGFLSTRFEIVDINQKMHVVEMKMSR